MKRKLSENGFPVGVKIRHSLVENNDYSDVNVREEANEGKSNCYCLSPKSPSCSDSGAAKGLSLISCDYGSDSSSDGS